MPTALLLLAFGGPAVGSTGWLEGSCPERSEYTDYLRMHHALAQGNYDWQFPGCEDFSIGAAARAVGKEPAEYAGEVAESLGGLPHVQSVLVLEAPMFGEDLPWRRYLNNIEGGQAYIDLRDRYPDFFSHPDIYALTDRRLSEAERAAALARTRARYPDIEHLSTPDGHPAVPEAIRLLGWTNPELSTDPVRFVPKPGPPAAPAETTDAPRSASEPDVPAEPIPAARTEEEARACGCTSTGGGVGGLALLLGLPLLVWRRRR